MEQKVGANSRITERFVAKPIRVSGKRGFSKFNAVCNAITPPMKNDIKAIMPKDLIPN